MDVAAECLRSGIQRRIMMAKVNALRQSRCRERNNNMAGKYTPLENYLRNVPKSQREVKLSFEEIEGILNAR